MHQVSTFAHFSIHFLRHSNTFSRRYIVCFGKKRVERECASGLFFNPRTSACDRPEKVDCTPDTSHLPSIECPKNNLVELYPTLHACNSYFICAGGRPSLHNCSNGLIFDIDMKRCGPPGRCLLDYVPECTPGEFLPHIFECRHFFYCNGETPVLSACAPGLLFDIASRQCNAEDLATCAAQPNAGRPIWPVKSKFLELINDNSTSSDYVKSLE